MPVVHLCDKNDPTKLRPLAHFVVLSAMLAPSRTTVREKFMDSVRVGISDRIRRGLFSDTEIRNIQQFGCIRGSEAAFILGALIQLNSQGKTPSLSTAINILVGELPTLPTSWKENWKPDHKHEHFPRSPRILRKVFQDFGSVAHLWSAFLLGEEWNAWSKQHGQTPNYGLLPISTHMLPRFLGTANAIWQLYDQISSLKRGNSVTHIKDPWHFVIPDSLRIERSMEAMPIPNDRFSSITRPIQLSP